MAWSSDNRQILTNGTHRMVSTRLLPKVETAAVRGRLRGTKQTYSCSDWLQTRTFSFNLTWRTKTLVMGR